MFEPEIDRRCSTCGATVRQQAAFCPQCGQMLERRDSPQEAEEIDQTEDIDQGDGVRANEDGQGAANEPAIKAPIVDWPEETEGTVTESSHATLHDDPNSYKTQPLIASTSLSNATVADLQETNFRRPGDAPPRTEATPRSDSRPRSKENQVLARVDKIRKVSSVMIDQAAYDPSLRFLLVAGALFVVFLILMIWSKVLG